MAVLPTTEPVPFDVRNLVKLSSATDGRTSSLAVYPDADETLRIVGLVDEGKGHGQQRNHAGGGFLLPGVFRLTALDVARVAAHVDMQLVAELNGRELTGRPLDVFSRGPILAKIAAGFEARLQERSSEPGGEALLELDQVARKYMLLDWTIAIRRLLLRTQGYRHGGALLLSPEPPPEQDLKVKYRLPYDRLGRGLAEQFVRELGYSHASEALLEVRGQTSQQTGEVFSRAIRDIVTRNDHDDSEEEVDGTIWFLSLLTRVDGLLTMDYRLEAYGFGAEILNNREPSAVLIARDELGSDTVPGSYEQWGTRHRSMMRYCASHPAATGFVVSQDGDVRAMTQVDGDLVVWDGVLLQRDYPAREHGTGRARGSTE